GCDHRERGHSIAGAGRVAASPARVRLREDHELLPPAVSEGRWLSPRQAVPAGSDGERPEHAVLPALRVRPEALPANPRPRRARGPDRAAVVDGGGEEGACR